MQDPKAIPLAETIIGTCFGAQLLENHLNILYILVFRLQPYLHATITISAV